MARATNTLSVHTEHMARWKTEWVQADVDDVTMHSASR